MKKKTWLILFIIIVVIALISVLVLPKILNKGGEKTVIHSEENPSNETEVDNALAYEHAMESFSTDRALAFLTELTSIESHSGWRGGGTEGERLAFDLVEGKLVELEWLNAHGMTFERENFNIFVGTEDHNTSVTFTAGDVIVEVPADSPRGHRNNISMTTQFDSDGEVTDSDSDPVEVSGEVVWIRDEDSLFELQSGSLAGQVALVNYLLVDTSVVHTYNPGENVYRIMDSSPAAVILYTQFSNTNGESHGTYLGDGAGAYQGSSWEGQIPVFFIELENLLPLGITNEDQLGSITNANVVWDVDVLNPAPSTNLIVHIPGQRSDAPVLLSAHLDSPNSPGALDDGSGSVIMMEILSVLNEQQIQPVNDLYLVWFGSEEILLYGSAYFTTTHSEIVNQLQANIQVDALSQPLDGLPAEINLVFSHFITDRVADDPLAVYLTDQAQQLGINTFISYWPFDSDNGCFSGYNVSNINMIYQSDELSNLYGGIWYGGQYHSPYDTVERVETVIDVFEEMGKLAMSAVFMPAPSTGNENSANKQALYLANHTESPHMTPAGMPQLAWALADAGYEVNVLPYGSELTAELLENVDYVVIPPAYDYPVSDNAANGYDTAWTSEEAQIINDYAQNSGIVLIINSANRLSLYNRLGDDNEDWNDLNTLTDQWGVHFTQTGTYTYSVPAQLSGSEVDMLLSAEATVQFSAPADAVKAGNSETAYLAELTVGDGKVIVVGDLTALGESYEGVPNPELIEWLSSIE